MRSRASRRCPAALASRLRQRTGVAAVRDRAGARWSRVVLCSRWEGEARAEPSFPPRLAALAIRLRQRTGVAAVRDRAGARWSRVVLCSRWEGGAPAELNGPPLPGRAGEPFASAYGCCCCARPSWCSVVPGCVVLPLGGRGCCRAESPAAPRPRSRAVCVSVWVVLLGVTEVVFGGPGGRVKRLFWRVRYFAARRSDHDVGLACEVSSRDGSGIPPEARNRKLGWAAI